MLSAGGVHEVLDFAQKVLGECSNVLQLHGHGIAVIVTFVELLLKSVEHRETGHEDLSVVVPFLCFML